MTEKHQPGGINGYCYPILLVCLSLVCIALVFGCANDNNAVAEEFLQKLYTIDEILPFEPTETAIDTRYQFAKEAMTESAYSRALKNRDLLVAWSYSADNNCRLKVDKITEVEPVYGGGTQRYEITLSGSSILEVTVDLRVDDNGKIAYFQPDITQLH